MWQPIKLSLLGLATLTALATPLKTPQDQNQEMIGVDADSYLYLPNDNVPPDGPGPAPGAPTISHRTPGIPPKPPPNYWLDRTRGDIKPAKPPSPEVCKYFYGITKVWLDAMDYPNVPTNATEYVAREHVIRLVWDNMKDPSGHGMSWDSDKSALDTSVIRNQPGEYGTPQASISGPGVSEPNRMNQWLWDRLNTYNEWAMNGMLLHTSAPVSFSYRIYHASELEEPSGKVPAPKFPDAPPVLPSKTTPFGSPIVNYPVKPPPPLHPVGSLPKIKAESTPDGRGPPPPPLPQISIDDDVRKEPYNQLKADLKKGIDLSGRILKFKWSTVDFDPSTKKMVEHLSGYPFSMARIFVWLIWGH